ncbi:MAG: transporter [Maricaulis sp.]|nr:transporter [Maricaulis sp.]
MMKRRLLLLAATSLVATSCASTTVMSGSAAIPAHAADWSVPVDGGPMPVDWVATFNDPRLGALVAEADGANPSLSAAFARLDAAQASARAANAGRLPSISAGGDVSRTERNAGGSNSFGADLSASWEVDVWGRLSDRARAGVSDAEASRADLDGARLSLAAQVAKAWFILLEARLQTELAERDVEAKERSLSFIERRFSAGVSRSSDVRTFRSALASSRSTLALRQRAEASAARSLEILLGRYPSNAIEHDYDLPDLGPLTGVGDPADLLVRRPDILAAEARLNSAGYRASEARRALLPRLSLTGTTGSGGTQIEDLLDPDTLVSNLIGSLTAPIFSGGALRAERDRSEAAARAQLHTYVNTVLLAWREAEDAIFSDALLAERVAAQTEAFEQAAAAEELVDRQYRSGLATIFELLDAQSRRNSAESLLYSARRERATNRVDIYLAIGGDFLSANAAQE